MSTYWYIDVDAPLRISDAEAIQAFTSAMSGIGHHLDDGHMFFADFIADGLPFRPAGSDDQATIELPEQGWTVANGRLHARLFAENLNRPVGADGASRNHDAMFKCLSEILEAEPGAIVGAVASEHAECKGPLARVGDVVRWLPSVAWNPGRGYDFGPELAAIDRIPPELLSDSNDGLTCKADVEALIARVKRG